MFDLDLNNSQMPIKQHTYIQYYSLRTHIIYKLFQQRAVVSFGTVRQPRRTWLSHRSLEFSVFWQCPRPFRRPWALRIDLYDLPWPLLFHLSGLIRCRWGRKYCVCALFVVANIPNNWISRYSVQLSPEENLILNIAFYYRRPFSALISLFCFVCQWWYSIFIWTKVCEVV